MKGEEIAFCELEAAKTGGRYGNRQNFRPPLTPLRKRDSAPKSNFLSVIQCWSWAGWSDGPRMINSPPADGVTGGLLAIPYRCRSLPRTRRPGSASVSDRAVFFGPQVLNLEREKTCSRPKCAVRDRRTAAIRWTPVTASTTACRSASAIDVLDCSNVRPGRSAERTQWTHGPSCKLVNDFHSSRTTGM